MYSFSSLSKRIKTNEGFRNKIYKDQLGKKTIGYGHLIKTKDNFIINKKYSKKILLKVFNKDLKKAIIDFKKNYRHKNMPKKTQEVIIEMIFQLGIKKVLKFKKFNKSIIEKEKYLAAFEMMNSLWYLQTPKRVHKLILILLK